MEHKQNYTLGRREEAVKWVTEQRNSQSEAARRREILRATGGQVSIRFV